MNDIIMWIIGGLVTVGLFFFGARVGKLVKLLKTIAAGIIDGKLTPEEIKKIVKDIQDLVK